MTGVGRVLELIESETGPFSGLFYIEGEKQIRFRSSQSMGGVGSVSRLLE